MILNKHYVNAAIKVNTLPDNEMRKIGFTDYEKEAWYYSRNLSTFDISFNVTINKNNPLDLSIDILDEDFLQPYDYQLILKRNPDHPAALQVQEFVEEQMEYFQKTGVLSGHVKGEYI